MLQRGIFVAIAPLLLLGASGCAHGGYKVIKEGAHGGEVALEGNEEESRPQAEGYMRGRCGSPGFAVVQEGQVKGAGAFRGGDSAWRITYRCKEKEKSYAEEPPSAVADAGSKKDGG